MLSAALLAMAIVLPVAAAEILSDDEPRVAQGETITEDLYVFGGDAEIAGTVTRDAIVATGQFDFAPTGRIDGNLMVAGGQVTIDGDVGRSVRIAAGEVTITGSIGSDLVVAAGRVEIERGAVVRGDLILAGGDVTIAGDVGGDVRGSAGSLEIDGAVAGSVEVGADDLSLGSRARVTGSVDYESENDLEQDDSAVVSGTVVQSEPDSMLPGNSGASWLTLKLYRLLCALVAGLVIILAVPKLSVSIANAARSSPGGSFLRGLLLLIVVPIGSVVLLVTIIGIPIAIIIWVAFIVTAYLSQVFVGLALGRFILPDRWGDLGRGYNLLAMTLGVIILFAPRFIPVPFLDGALSVVIALIGLGATMIGITLRRQYSVSYATT